MKNLPDSNSAQVAAQLIRQKSAVDSRNAAQGAEPLIEM